jgi:hypothetical protein
VKQCVPPVVLVLSKNWHAENPMRTSTEVTNCWSNARDGGLRA